MFTRFIGAEGLCRQPKTLTILNGLHNRVTATCQYSNSSDYRPEEYAFSVETRYVTLYMTLSNRPSICEGEMD